MTVLTTMISDKAHYVLCSAEEQTSLL
jgi:hypothetical protein